MNPYMIDYRLINHGSALSVVSVTISSPGRECDATKLVQSAIDECAENGGGTVLLSSGEYCITSPIEVKSSVILTGEYDPTISTKADRQTVILCGHGIGTADAPAQFSMKECSSLKNLVLYYPDQSIDSPTPTAPTISQDGIDSIMLENVILVNPWLGIKCGPGGNELHYLKNVLLTPLHTGLYIDMTTDIGRIEGLRVTPDCYINYTHADADAVRRYMLSNVTGFFMARSDWEYCYGFEAEYCKIGILITNAADCGPNAQLSSTKLKNCDISINVVNVNPYGIAISDSTIDADIPGLTAVIKTEETFKTFVSLNGVDINANGCYKNIIVHDSHGQLSLGDCTITGYLAGQQAVICKSGALSLVSCDFCGDGDEFYFGENAIGVQIIGCTFKSASGEAHEPSIDNPSGIKLEYSADEYKHEKASRGGHIKYPYKTCPDNEALFIPRNYAALRNTDADATADIAETIALAASSGGGIVYLPGGYYTCHGRLNIPSGVELRGIADAPFHPIGGGTFLMFDCGAGDENAEPFVTLEEHSGIRGVGFYNIKQDPEKPIEYPFAVRSLGKRCYVINASFVNTWQGLDMASFPSDDHYVSYISGAPIKCGVYVGSNDGDGWVENIQFNPHYWYRSHLPGTPDFFATWNAFWFNQMKLLDAIKFGYNRSEHLLGTFVFAAKHGLTFVKQNGRGTSGKFIGHGTDSGLIALYLCDADDIELINTQLVNIVAEGRRSYILSEEGDCGKYRIYNTLMWGDPHYAAIFGGGNIFIMQMNIVDPGRVAITVNGGNIELCSVFFAKSPMLCEIGGGETKLIAPMTTGYGKEDDGGYSISLKSGQLYERFATIKE